MSTRRQFTSSALRALALLGLILTLAVTALTTTPAHAAKALSPADVTPVGTLSLWAKDGLKDTGIPSATILAWNAKGELIVKGVTNAKGNYISKVSQGIYKFEVTSKGYGTYSDVFKVAAGQITAVQVVMKPAKDLTTAPAVIPLDPFIGTLSLWAKDSVTDEGIAAAGILAWNAKGEVVVKGVTNAKGNYDGKLPEGIYKLQVTSQGYETYKEVFKIAGGQITDVQVAMNPAKDLTTTSAQAATVLSPADIAPSTIGTLNLSAKDSVTDEGIAAAGILAWNVKGEVVVKGVTDAKGYLVAKLPEGTYELQVTSQGYETYKEVFKIAAGQITDVNAMLAAIAKPEGVLTLQVVDAQGKGPIYEATVYIYDVDGQLVAKGLTGKYGDFTVALPEGTYIVEASSEGYNTYIDKTEVSSGKVTYLEVSLVPLY